MNLIMPLVDRQPRSFLLYAGEGGAKSSAGKKGKY